MVSLEVESWLWYGFVMMVASSRFISRRMTLGSFRRFQFDDHIMLGALCFYTTLIATINIVRHTNSNLLPPGYDTQHLSKQDIQERTYGSKLILVVEQCQCVTIWCVKACLIIMYLRLTTMRKENIAIKVLAGYVAFGFCFMEIFYFGVWCRPFHDYWAVPTPHVQCDAATNHLITNATFNISSDCIMLAIGLPMFLRMHLPLKKKIPLVGIFSLGIFVILAAILNKVYSFTEPFGAMWTYWYVRESSTALLVANLPFVWTFWRRAFGVKTTNGVSFHGTGSPEVTRTHEDGRGDPRKHNDQSGTLWPYKMNLGDESTEDLEQDISGPLSAPAVLSFNDILKEGHTNFVNEKEVSPITHPSLFYGKRKDLVLEEKDHVQCTEMEFVGKKTQREQNDTPESSLFPQSLSSRKSAGSLV